MRNISSENDCIGSSKIFGGHFTRIRGSAVDYGSIIPAKVPMSRGASVIFLLMYVMGARHLKFLKYYLKFLGSKGYDGDNMDY